MTSEFTLLRARELANIIRFSGDLHGASARPSSSELQSILDNYYRYGVEVNERLTPPLEIAAVNVCERLKIDRHCVSIFVTNSHEAQASCYFVDPSNCIVSLSSSLVNHLELDELEFVLGHEIGHFLLQHGPSGSSEKTLEFFLFQRAKEISVDRIGMFACGNVETALRALIKTASGLRSGLITVDSEYYLNQISKISVETTGEHPLSTHPSILIRVAALNEFSRGFPSLSFDAADEEEVLKRDQKIKKYLDEYVDKDVQRRIRSAKNDFELWLAAQIVTNDGRFDSDEQYCFETKFGADTLWKFKVFLKEIPASQVSREIAERIELSKIKLLELAPHEGQNFLVQAEKELFLLFGRNQSGRPKT